MSFLLDTNVVSEWVKPRPDRSVIRWLDEVDEDSVYLSSMTLGELREGVDRLAPGRRHDQLDQWLGLDLPERFDGRVLPVDAAVAQRWGVIRASAARTGRIPPVVDSLIAATALEHGFAVVTRNVRDFRAIGVRTVDPWTEVR